MVSSPRPPRPGPASTTTGARKPSARCSSALGWVVAMNVLLAATQIAVGSAVKSLALVADGVHTLEPRETATWQPRVYVKGGKFSEPASISDATTQMDHNALVLFTIDRLDRSPRTTVRRRSTGKAPDR